MSGSEVIFAAPILVGMEQRGDDFLREDFGGLGDLDVKDTPRLAEFGGDAWGDLD